jgi:hypothetical protein
VVDKVRELLDLGRHNRYRRTELVVIEVDYPLG